jgi:hypothetical protein
MVVGDTGPRQSQSRPPATPESRRCELLNSPAAPGTPIGADQSSLASLSSRPCDVTLLRDHGFSFEMIQALRVWSRLLLAYGQALSGNTNGPPISIGTQERDFVQVVPGQLPVEIDDLKRHGLITAITPFDCVYDCAESVAVLYVRDKNGPPRNTPLTPKQSRVLELLLRVAGEPCSHETLVRHVYGETAAVGSNFSRKSADLERLINRGLRPKLSAIGLADAIGTSYDAYIWQRKCALCIIYRASRP